MKKERVDALLVARGLCESREQAKRQANAAEAIEDDPFVRELVRDLGAEVVSSSIRPADEAAGKPTER